MDTILLDLRDTLRGLRRDPIYALAIIATLALTLGATTAVFSIVNGVLLRPLPYADPDRLVSLREVVPSIANQYPTLPANGRHFDTWRSRMTTVKAMSILEWRNTTLTGAGDPAQLSVVRASGTLFDVLDARVALGRPLTRADEQPDRPAVAVISDRLWADRFGRDPQALGRPVVLGGTQYTIVGILEPSAQLPRLDGLGGGATMASSFSAVIPFRIPFTNFGWMGNYNYPVVARLNPGATREQAIAEMNVVQHAIAEVAAKQTHEPEELRGTATPLAEAIVGRARLGLLLLLAAIGGVVLIACANLANLSLTRALGRSRDAAVRSALGASRGRLVLGIAIEQLLLAAIGGLAGLLVARQSLTIFVMTAPIDVPRVNDVTIDARVLAFAAALTVFAALCVALLPAWRLGRGDLQGVLRGGGRGTTDRGVLRVRSTLLAVQVALSVSLLVVTGLFVASYLHLLKVDPGFSADRVVAIEIAPVARRYPDSTARAALYDRVLAETRTLPGITAAAWTSALPLTGETWVDLVALPDDVRPTSQKPRANYRFVGPEYFKTLAMPLTRGRSIDDRDRSHAIVPAVLSAAAAEALWPGGDPVGRQFTRADPGQRFEVVGVVADGHPTALESDPPLMVYVPYWYNNEGKSVLLVRTAGDAAALGGELRRVVHGVDPEIAVADVSPMPRLVDRAFSSRRYQVWLFGAFGAIALLIATVGVYATTAYGVSRRRREMNIRVALGARTTQVFGLILRQSAASLLIGILAGCAGALAIGRVVANLLFKVRASDPIVLITVAGIVGAIGLIASATATRQGLHLDPASALRDE